MDFDEHLSQHMMACSDEFISHCNNSAHYLLDRVLMLVVREIPCESYHLTIIRLMQNLKKKHQDKETLVFCVVYQVIIEMQLSDINKEKHSIFLNFYI